MDTFDRLQIPQSEEGHLNDSNVCSLSGKIQLFCEAYADLNLLVYLNLLQAKANFPTKSLTIQFILHEASILILSSLIVFAIDLSFGIGLESTQSCGVEFDSSYSELVRKWRFILVPIFLFKAN